MANRVEELKALKDGLDVLPDISRFAHEGVDAIPAGDLDRLKWYGLFHRKATPVTSCCACASPTESSPRNS